MPVVPPPPPGPPPPPAYSLSLAPAKVDSKGRDLLLQSIRKGATLKKTTTNDKSGPLIQRKANGGSDNNSSSVGNNTFMGSATISRCSGLAGLFADGMPKLKPVNANHNQSSSHSSLPTANISSLHNNVNNNNNNRFNKPEIAKKLMIDIKNRGPPPQPPTLAQKPVITSSTSETTLTSPAVNTHTRSVSSVSLANGRGGGHFPGRMSKPQLAPKPPAPAPPVAGNKRAVTRAHSMKVPASPPIVPISPQGTPFTNGPAFPTLSKTTGFHASSDCLSARQRPVMRPPLRPPMSRPPPPPTVAVPPPPTTAVPPPPPPSVPPPPPPLPHRPAPPKIGKPCIAQVAVAKAGPLRLLSTSNNHYESITHVIGSTLPNNSVPPTPPSRHSSIRNGNGPASDFEMRFAYSFHSVNEFPPPQPYIGVQKVYSSRLVGKAPAPAPPSAQIQLGPKMWANNTSSC